MKPRLLDLFCGAGGAAMGYHRAGFEVVGVDIKPQKHYPFEFHQADAMTYPLEGFDVIHASPPCQAYMRSGNVTKEARSDLLVLVRQRLGNRQWIIENVPGAPIRGYFLMCGSMFDLPIRRHRYFEASKPTFVLAACNHSKRITGVYGHPHGKNSARAYPGMLPSDLKTWSDAMEIDWMTAYELSQAVPPAYTEFIGKQLMENFYDDLR